MPSTPTTRNRFNRQGTGDSVGSWGTVLNAQVFDLVDEAIDGITPLTVTGNVTLSSANYATDQSRKRILKLSGSPGASFTIVIPSVEKWYLVHNTTAFAQTVKASGGLGVSVPANTMVPIYCDGTDTFSPTVGLTAPVGTVVDFAGSTAPTGWLFCAGQAISRTTYSSLFVIIGTTYGAGDGSTTFELPDLRGRASFGKDNMGGSTASRITNAVAGFVGTTLGAVGGSQSLTAHSHGITDPTHNHTHSETAHNHTHNEVAHTHTFSDPGHSHGYSEGGGGAGHQHTYNEPAGAITVQSGTGAAAYSTSNPAAGTSFATTGIVISSNTTGASIVGNTTGITNNAASTGITNNSASTGITGTTSTGSGASQNVPPAMILNKIIYTGV